MVACQNGTRELDSCESLPNSHYMEGCSSGGWVNFCDALPEGLVGTLPRLQVDEQLSRSTLDKVFVGHLKESMSVVDEKLVVNDVCSMFGSHIKYLVQLQLTVPDVPQSSQTLRNAFTILMSSSRARESEKKLPLRTKKDQLYNDVVYFWEWTTGGDSHGKKFVQQLQETLWYIDGHHQSHVFFCAGKFLYVGQWIFHWK